MERMVNLKVVFAMAATAVMLLAGASASTADDIAQRLIGSWRLVSYEDKPAVGASVFPYDTEPKGLLLYDANGHMAIQIMKNPGHPKVTSGDEEKVTPLEKQALLDAYIAYFGTYVSMSPAAL